MTDREKAIVMAYTGYTMLAGDKLGIYYQYVQEKLGRSVMTHELTYEEVQDAIREASKEDFIALAKDNDFPRNGWISVKDRLPDRSGNYLVHMSTKERSIIKTSYWITSTQTWLGVEACSVLISITHWMPLPEPPEVKQDADD